MIRVLVNGYRGRMGRLCLDAVSKAEDMLLVAGFDPKSAGDEFALVGATEFIGYDDLHTALKESSPDVCLDFTNAEAARENLPLILALGIPCVVGTTGLSTEELEGFLAQAPAGTGLFVAPNFTLGAVLMMHLSTVAARFFEDVEIIEFHHTGKKDAPSGTAVSTARLIGQQRTAFGLHSLAPGRESELAIATGARGAVIDGVPVHAIRAGGYVANQEVIFANKGENLIIRHESTDRAAYMPGVLLAIRKVGELSGLVIGLDKLLDLEASQDT